MRNKYHFKESEQILIDLINAFVLCKNFEEGAFFLQDLLTKSELKILSRRLRVAKLLIDGYSYREIIDILHVGHSTISKVAVWLSERGRGFKTILKKLPENKEDINDPLKISPWEELKRKYPTYFFPEIVIEQIGKSLSSNRNKRTKEIIGDLNVSLKQKREIHKEIEEHFR